MKLALILPFLAIVVFSTLAVADTDDKPSSHPEVTVQQGKLQGITLESRKGKKYSAFLGVPYGKAPVRFGPPEAADSWTGVKVVGKKAPHCYQFCLLEQRLVGVEDCLTLNVYTPDLSGKKPVMVLLHGGGFQFGTGSLHDARYFMDEDVILVTIQYRLGALGFLNLQDDIVSGNMGLKDQSFALKWVQENIHAFGGDKDHVSIFGFSAGGASVHYQMLSPMSKGLFKNAISQSGSALNPWAFQPKPKVLARRLAEMLDCAHETSEETVKCFRSKKASEIVTAQLKFSKYPHEFDILSMLFCPSVDGGTAEPKFLPDTPYKTIVNGKTASKVPWIIGFTKEEGALYTALILENDKSLELINSDWKNMSPNILYYEYTASPAAQKLISEKVHEFYFGNDKIGRGNYLQLGNYYGDRFFVVGVHRAIREHAKKPDFPVYPYVFSYAKGPSIVEGFLHASKSYGVAHADDLKFLFNKTYGSPEFDLSQEEGQFSEKLIKLYVSFARDGKPTGTWGPENTWKPFKLSGENIDEPIPWYMLDEETKVLTEDPFKDRVNFWENLPLKELEKEDYADEKDEL